MLTRDKVGNLYLGGYVSSSIRGDSIPPYASTGLTDFFVMKFGVDYDCTPSDAPQPDFIYSLDPNVHGKVSFQYTGSTLLDSVTYDFGDGSIAKGDTQVHNYQTLGQYEVCVRAYNRCGIKEFCKTVDISVGITSLTEDALRIYPNPMGNLLMLEGLLPGTRAELFNIMGQPVGNTGIRGQREQLSVAHLPSGTY